MARSKDIIEKAKADLNEFRALFEGKPFADVDQIVKENNLSYGAANPEWGDYMRDIDFKSICATVRDKNGISFVSDSIEIYGADGIFYGTITV
jgi:hypothetical protein